MFSLALYPGTVIQLSRPSRAAVCGDLQNLNSVPAAARLLAQNMHYLGIDDEEVRGAILAYLDSMHESGGGGGGPRAQQATR